MKLQEFKEQGFVLRECAPVSFVEYEVDLIGVGELEEDEDFLQHANTKQTNIIFSYESSHYAIYTKNGEMIVDEIPYNDVHKFIKNMQ